MKDFKLLLFIAASLIIVAAVTAYAQEESVTYHACVNNASGTIFVVEAGQDCKANENRITWNQQGPPGPAGTSEAWQTTICSVGCDEPILLTPSNGFQDIMFVDLPAGQYVINAYIDAQPPVEYDDSGNPIGRGPGGFLTCTFFQESEDGSRIDLEGVQTPSFGNDVDGHRNSSMTHTLQFDDQYRLVLACEFDPASVDPSFENQAIEVLSGSFTAVRVDVIHYPSP